MIRAIISGEHVWIHIAPHMPAPSAVSHNLQPDVKHWLDQNCSEPWCFSYDSGDYCLDFSNQTDYTLFKMRWE